MSSFTQPHRGENAEQFEIRRREMIEFVARRHVWTFERTVTFLTEMNHIGIAYIGVDMKEEQRARRSDRAYDPFARLYADFDRVI